MRTVALMLVLLAACNSAVEEFDPDELACPPEEWAVEEVDDGASAIKAKNRVYLIGGYKNEKLDELTNSHQFPLGGRLALSRRQALLEWAEQHDALIVEDDYDSEFRFDAPPLPALASLDRAGRVAYVGTFSKVLSPALLAMWWLHLL